MTWFKESDTLLSGILKIEAAFLFLMGVVICFYSLEIGLEMIAVALALVLISKL